MFLVFHIDIKVRQIRTGQSKNRKNLLLLDFAIVMQLGFRRLVDCPTLILKQIFERIFTYQTCSDSLQIPGRLSFVR